MGNTNRQTSARHHIKHHIKNGIFGILAISFAATSAFAERAVPYSPKFQKEINETFFSDRAPFSGVSQNKTAAFRANILQRRKEVFENLVGQIVFDKEKSRKEAEEKASTHKLVRAYDLVIQYVDAMTLTNGDTKEAYRLAARAMELSTALMFNGEELGVQLAVEYVDWFFKSWKVAKSSPLEAEASNLKHPENGNYLDPQDLVKFDISLLDPPTESTFWKKPADISKIKVADQYYGGKSQLQKDFPVVFPATSTLIYDDVRETQTKPKFDVYGVGPDGKKREYKLKIAAEMHSDPTVSSLLTALGYSTDVTKYVRDIKVVLPEGTTVSDVRSKWQGYFSADNLANLFDNYRPETYITGQGFTEDGREYFTLSEGVLEAKPKNHLRIGGWEYEENGYLGNRETRGLFIFDLWVNNGDWDAENNKLVMKREEDGSYSMHHIQHDMGHSMGMILREKPEAFTWNMIRKNTSKEIEFEYQTYRKNGLFGKVTFSDAKWMVRNMSQLTRSQITEAIEIGGWPTCIAKLYVEKLISRRNDLVKQFGVLGEVVKGREVKLLAFDRKLTIPGCLKDGELVNGKFEGYTQDFGSYKESLFGPIKGALKQLVDVTFQQIVAGISKMKVEPSWFGWDDGLIAEVIIDMGRDVVPNPKPESHLDHFLVEDTWQLGGRLGAGIVVSGDVSYVERYKLVYPVQYEKDGIYSDNRLINFKLPAQVAAGKLPEKYVLVRETYFEGRGRVKVDTGFIGVGIQGSKSKVRLSRVIVDKRNPDFSVFYDDTSFYDKEATSLFMKLGFIKLPFTGTDHMRGQINREAYMISNDDLMANGDLAAAATAVYRDGNFGAFEGVARKVSLDSQFETSGWKYSIFGLINAGAQMRLDNIRIQDQDLAGNVNEQQFIQMKVDQSKSWKWMDDGESLVTKIHAFAGKDLGEGNDAPVVEMEFSISDKNTKSTELAEEYLNFINEAADDNDFILLTPELHSKNGLWGAVNTHVYAIYYQEALNKILSLASDDKVWQYYYALGATVGLTPQEVVNAKMGANRTNRIKAHHHSPSRFSRSIERFEKNSPKGRFLDLLQHSQKFLSSVKKAAKAKSPENRIRFLSKALKDSVYKKAGTFKMAAEGKILSALNKLVGSKNYFMAARITAPSDQEKRLLIKKDMYNEQGTWRPYQLNYYTVSPDEPAELYHISNWMFGMAPATMPLR